MSAVHAETTAPAATAPAQPAATQAEAPPGDPAVLGLPAFAVGSIALGLALVGYVSPAAQGSALPIIFAMTGLGLLLSTVWAASLGQTMVATIFGLFAGFWLSYTVLIASLTHGWFPVPPADVQHTVALFLISWAVIMAALALATVRLPVAFTAVVALVVLALVLLIFGTLNTSETLTKAAGWVTLVFAALGVYLFLSAASAAGGGKSYPLGPPLVK
ncbi:GPR1/FUN34/YaaH family transporter [Conexibacter sp. CPCC 206217]|uniref:GPR1/FUN34/YaaH family transporter n=1 Tax=Conexibacter sp. CPCC 206217 TaxID=3064574 RepID=UPI00271D2147|nr:GPR1/FUN34/YaaH family transporter [Conexibacter sp. CPCC 206217]MDO8212466.1 GPR1/FUN34/YaaH family transporter [Conexibacter sp. CPCC 206217]